MSIDSQAALRFAQEWIEAWNAHDLDAVLSHYTDDFEMSSPFIAAFTGEPSGMLKGKAEVRAYWRKALERIPDLRFELLGAFAGAGSIAVHYKAVLGKLAIEVFLLDGDGRVRRAFAHYDS